MKSNIECALRLANASDWGGPNSGGESKNVRSLILHLPMRGGHAQERWHIETPKLDKLDLANFSE